MARFGSFVIMIPFVLMLLFNDDVVDEDVDDDVDEDVVVVVSTDARLRIHMFMTPLGDGAK